MAEFIYDFSTFAAGFRPESPVLVDAGSFPDELKTQAEHDACNWMLENTSYIKVIPNVLSYMNYTTKTADVRKAAKMVLEGKSVELFHIPKLRYNGWTVIDTGDDECADIYSHPEKNMLNTPIGGYVLMQENGAIVDSFKWTGSCYARLKSKAFKSEGLGHIEPLDAYQRCVFDSLNSNDYTAIYGPAGSGKTLIPLSYIMQEIEKGSIDRCHFIFHYEKLKYSRELGYVKGSQRDKLLQSGSLGNILTAKLGGEEVVEQLLDEGRFNIIPTSSVRGFEAGEHDVIFCTEAQDLDPYTTRTIIQRAKQGCKVIFEGDINEQVDIPRQSGLGKMIDVYKGNNGFGCVRLVQDYRSELGRLADNIK